MRVQALADISRLALCCHSNDTRAPIASPPNSAQLEGTPYHAPKLHPGPCSSVVMPQGTDRHTDGRDQYTFRPGVYLDILPRGDGRNVRGVADPTHFANVPL